MVAIFDMGMLSIILKERNIQRFTNVAFDRTVIIFYGICHFCFICYAVGSLQYSKSVWSKVGTPTVPYS
jgi:hypothetical protein